MRFLLYSFEGVPGSSTVLLHYNRPTEGGDILFLMGFRWHPRCFVSGRYLLNQWTDFDKTCTDTLLGGQKELIRFSDHDLIFKVTTTLLNVLNFVSACYLLNRMMESDQN